MSTSEQIPAIVEKLSSYEQRKAEHITMIKELRDRLLDPDAEISIEDREALAAALQ